MQTVPIYTECSCCLSDVCCDGDDERDGDVLEYKDPGSLISTCQPIADRVSERCPAYAIPFQAAPTALRLLQSIEKALPQLRVRYHIRNQQKEIARKSHSFIRVCPWLQIDCCGGYEAREKEDDREEWD